ncbi:MAG: DUF559 domain-containing protein, partial [Firmicutes bacterium]|nr:DUF559 domain-containing protein [Bacillota bacterium]
KRLILHAQDPYQWDRALETQNQAESEFERQVLHRLLSAGYRVTPQWEVGAYRIDMVVEGGGQRLAIECDGDRWHPPEKLDQDMARQAILERLGWHFLRIRGTQFFRYPDDTMQNIFDRLAAEGITPQNTASILQTGRNTPNTEIKEWIIRRAEEIRRGWPDIDTFR